MSAAASHDKPLVHRLTMPLFMAALAGLGVAFWPEADDASSRVTADTAESIAPIQPSRVGKPHARRPSSQEFAAAQHALAQLRSNMGGGAEPGGARRRLIDELDRQHRTEPIDSSWSAQSEVEIMTAAIQPAMVNSGPTPQDFAADCRSRTCRISATFESTGAAQNWGINLTTRLGATLAQSKLLLATQPDGRIEVRVYGARKPSGTAPVQSRSRSAELVASYQSE